MLTVAEIYELTGRKQPAAQTRWLTRAGWKFARDSDGYPIVAREEFRRNLIGAATPEQPMAQDQDAFEVNIDALRHLSQVA